MDRSLPVAPRASPAGISVQVNMTNRVAVLVDGISGRAHRNAASRLALGLVEVCRVEVAAVSYGADPSLRWLPASARTHPGVDTVSRSILGIVASRLRAQVPDVSITRQIHADFAGLTASSVAPTPSGRKGRLVLVQDHPCESSHASDPRSNKRPAHCRRHGIEVHQ